MERAIAACRAAFALMDIKENHDNNINHLIRPEGPGEGYASENIFHSGPDSTHSWSGFNWSAGGALAASAYLERTFGSVWVDGALKEAIPVDGTVASVVSWEGTDISLAVDCALKALPTPYTQPREATVKFGRLAQQAYNVTINGKLYPGMNCEDLTAGIRIALG